MATWPLFDKISRIVSCFAPLTFENNRETHLRKTKSDWQIEWENRRWPVGSSVIPLVVRSGLVWGSWHVPPLLQSRRLTGTWKNEWRHRHSKKIYPTKPPQNKGQARCLLTSSVIYSIAQILLTLHFCYSSDLLSFIDKIPELTGYVHISSSITPLTVQPVRPSLRYPNWICLNENKIHADSIVYTGRTAGYFIRIVDVWILIRGYCKLGHIIRYSSWTVKNRKGSISLLGKIKSCVYTKSAAKKVLESIVWKINFWLHVIFAKPRRMNIYMSFEILLLLSELFWTFSIAT